MTWYGLKDNDSGEFAGFLSFGSKTKVAFETLEDAKKAADQAQKFGINCTPAPLVEPDEPIDLQWLKGVRMRNKLFALRYDEEDGGDWYIVQDDDQISIPTPAGKRALLALLAALGIEQSKGGA